MKTVLATAPGKVVLSGEYAVLDGAPAIALAVDRRAQVAIRQQDRSPHRVDTPGLAAAERCFTVRSGAFDWQDDLPPWELLECCWRAAGVDVPEPLAIRLDTRAFRDPRSGRKIGVGSSAALASALSIALCAVGADERDPRQVAMRAHHTFQHGKGSGLDVATSFSGGVVEFRMGEPSGRQQAWPDGLHYAILWSGVEVDTAARIARLAGAEVHSSRQALAAAAAAVVAAWRSSAPAAVLDSLVSYVVTLERFSTDHALGIFDAGHAALVGMARRDGLVYKPCGAGGGDIGIVLGTDVNAIEAFVGLAADCGFVKTNLSIDTAGARTEAARSD